MAGTKINLELQGLESAEELLQAIAGKLADLQPAMEAVGAIILSSVQENFEEGGRPEKWPPLKPSTLKKRKSSGGPLVVKGWAGGLLGSLNYRAELL